MQMEKNRKITLKILTGLVGICIVIYLAFSIAIRVRQVKIAANNTSGTRSPLVGSVKSDMHKQSTLTRQHEEIKQGNGEIDTKNMSPEKSIALKDNSITGKNVSSRLRFDSRTLISEIPTRIQGLYVNEQGEEPTYREKLKAIYSFPKDLTEDERDALYVFLGNSKNDKEYLHIKDEIMCRLEKQEKMLPEYIDRLTNISLDKDIDGDLRGYAMQHLRSAYRGVDDRQREKLQEVYYKGLEDTSTDVAGTALLALVNLSEDYTGFDENRIQEAALKIASDPKVQAAIRITAVQLCGQLHIPESLYLARNLAIGSNETALRLAAIGTIGEMGTGEDLALLEKIKDDEKHKILFIAVEVAENKIKERINF